MSLLVFHELSRKVNEAVNKGKGIAPSKSNPNINSTLKNPLPYLLSNLVFHYLNYHFTPFVILKFKKAPIIHGLSSIIIHHHPKL